MTTFTASYTDARGAVRTFTVRAPDPITARVTAAVLIPARLRGLPRGHFTIEQARAADS